MPSAHCLSELKLCCNIDMYLALNEGKPFLWIKTVLLLLPQAAIVEGEEPVIIEKGRGRGHGKG